MANREMPSLVALLGLLAVAGYQNRDKLQQVLGGLAGGQKSPDGSPNPDASQTGGLGSILGGALGGASAGGLGSILSGGLGDLMDRFNQTGTGAKAQSWVNSGANEPIDTTELEQTLGGETIDALSRQTGLSRQDLLDRLAKVLPDAVNTLTPEGHIPSETEANRFVG